MHALNARWFRFAAQTFKAIVVQKEAFSYTFIVVSFK